MVIRRCLRAVTKEALYCERRADQDESRKTNDWYLRTTVLFDIFSCAARLIALGLVVASN